MKLKNLFIAFVTLLVSLSFAPISNAQKTKKVITTKKTVVSAKGTLSVEAGLVFNSGDVKPVARVNFYLLNDNLEAILSKAGIEPHQTIDPKASRGALLGGINAPQKAVSFVESYAIWSSSPDLYDDKLQQSQEALKSHIIATMTTDFSGKGDFSQVKAGNYYLMGVGGTGKQAVLWNMPIEIKAGKQSVILDNKNASEIF